MMLGDKQMVAKMKGFIEQEQKKIEKKYNEVQKVERNKDFIKMLRKDYKVNKVV